MIAPRRGARSTLRRPAGRRRSSSTTPTRPPSPRPAQVRAGLRARGPLHRRARAPPDRHGRLRRLRAAGDDAARAPRPPTRYGHLYLTLNEPAARRRATACRTPRSSAGCAARWGSTPAHARQRRGDRARSCSTRRGARARRHLEALQRDGWVRIGFPPARRRSPRAASPRPTGKVQLLNEALAKRGRDGLVGYVPPHEVADPELAARYPLALLVPASRFFLNSTFGSLPWHRGPQRPAAAAPAPGRRRRARPVRRRERARLQRPRRVHRRGRGLAARRARASAARSRRRGRSCSARAATTRTPRAPSATPTWPAPRRSTTTAWKSHSPS